MFWRIFVTAKALRSCRRVEEVFGEDDFPGDAHESEQRFRIGPIPTIGRALPEQPLWDYIADENITHSFDMATEARAALERAATRMSLHPRALV